MRAGEFADLGARRSGLQFGDASARSNAELSFKQNYIGDRGIIPVADVLQHKDKLKTINLAGNGIRNRGVHALVEVCKFHPSLTSIDLSNNYISQHGSLDLLEMLRTNPRIVSLDFSGNPIDAALRLKLRMALERNQTGKSRTEG